MKKSLHFKSREKYLSWLKYGHSMTKKGLVVRARKGRKSVFASTPGYQKIVIHGRPHKVYHS